MENEGVKIKIVKVYPGNIDKQENYEEEVEEEKKPELSPEQIQNFLSDCETQIKKISDIIENSDINLDVNQKIMNETENFGSLVNGKYGSDIEYYLKDEQKVRADFNQLVQKTEVAMDYYITAQNLKANGTSVRHYDEYLIFLKSYESGKILKKVLNKYLYKKFAASLHKNDSHISEDSSLFFNYFLTFFKNFILIQKKLKLNLSKLIQAILTSFDSYPDSKEKNPFYHKLKEQYEKICFPITGEESKESKSELNKNIEKMLLSLKFEGMQMQASEDFKDVKKLVVSESEIQARMKLNMEMQTVSWNIKNDAEYIQFYILRKLLNFYITKQEQEKSNANEESINKARALKEQLVSIVSNLEDYACNNSWHIITKVMKNNIDSGKFTKTKLKELWDNQLFDKVYDKNFKRLKVKDREEAFCFIINLIDVFCNIKEDEELKMFDENFTKHLKNVKEIVSLLKNGSLRDFKEYTLIVEYRLGKVQLYYSSYSLSREIDKYLQEWIQILMD